MTNAAVYIVVFLCLFVCNNQILTHSYSGGNGYNQWSNPGAGAYAGHQQQQGFGGSPQRGNNGGNFGQWGGGGYSQNKGGQQWQSGGQGAEAYKTNVFNEPDRYGYDYTIPGATVHYLMYKKQGNRGPANYGGSVDNGWNKKY